MACLDVVSGSTRYIDTPLALIGPSHFFTSLATNLARYSGERRSGATGGDAGLAQLGLHGRILKRLSERVVERFHDRGRRALREEEPKPGAGLEIRAGPHSLAVGTPGSNSSGYARRWRSS